MKSTHRFFSAIGISLMFMLGTLRLLAAPDGIMRQAAQATPVTASATIEPGTEQTMGDTDVMLAFDPGADGEVTVTLVPTTPVNPPPGGAIARSWFITTTAENYAVTATFGYSLVTPADVVIAFDRSGSMEFNTLCYGCWTPGVGLEYPDGNRWPLPWNGPADGPPAHCSGSAPVVINNYTYALIEAEEYSAITNTPKRYAMGYTYWVIQRNGDITEPNAGYLGDTAARGRDARGAYIGHFPYRVGFVGEPDGDMADPGASGVPCVWEDISNGFICRRGDWIDARSGPFPAPRADYEFTVPLTPTGGNTWYLWIRAQGGDPASDPNSGQGVFWGLDGTLLGRGAQNHAAGDGDYFKYNGANPAHWIWRRLELGATGGGGNGNALAPGSTHTLNLWAGSAGFTIDQLLITNYSGNVSDSTTNTMPRDNNRTDYACYRCDARFGGYPGGPGDDGPPNCNDPALPEPSRYRYLDPIYDDEQSLASTAAATARFMRNLDIAQHQIGLVRYSSSAELPVELLCLESHGAGCNADLIENTLVAQLMNRQQTYADGSTNIPDALEESIKLLDSDPPHNGRPTALPVIILITDGTPNTYENLSAANADCDTGNLYPGGTAAQECTLYMAQRAHEQGILIYAISIGEGSDRELMQAIADATGGIHVHAETPEALDAIFDYLQRYLAAPMRALYHRESAGEPWQMHPLTLTEAAASTFRNALIDLTGKNITTLSEWTLGPLPVLMTAQPATLTANGETTSTIVATVLEGYYGSELWPAADGVITFAASLGTVTPITTLTTGGVATAVLTSGLDGGRAVVTATNGEMTGVVTIALIPEAAPVISLIAGAAALPADGQATTVITATATDGTGLPITDGTPVTFTTSLGEIAPAIAATAGGVATATLTASLDAGIATITATTGSATGTVDVAFVPPPPHTVSVQAQDTILLADGHSSTILTATVSDSIGRPVADGTDVAFTTTLGTLAPLAATTGGGIVTATLTAGPDAGVATVTATSGDAAGTVDVAFVPLAPHVSMVAHPEVLPADGQSTAIVSAIVTDGNGDPVADATPVTFTTTLGEIAPAVAATGGGVATATLTAGLDVGVATVSATTGDVTGTVDVTFVAPPPYTVTVQAQPTALPANGRAASAITATITDITGRPVVDGTPVTLTASLGTLAFDDGTAEIPLRGETQSGLITATFTAGLTPGRAQVVVAAGQVQGNTWLDLSAQIFLPLVLRH
ncbi:MAG: VWA domain-containing protein [Anaerolineae bacterium]|nr:VWA domain-containing protein [Anaerolineae bacterium]